MHAGFPRPFGRYTLLAELGRGGMGEVYAATMPGGLPGIEKRCVIKTVHARATRDREAVARFLDEARLVVHLNQRNICSVFDVGVVDDGTHYLAMELVRGRDLRTIWTRVGDRGDLIPPALAIHIAVEVLDGLHYAHGLCDDAGRPLHVVHRDVSPQNVMVSFDGDVKLIDFGLAASTMKQEQTQANIVLGKLGYLSPEQVRGERADARADVFSTAVVLCELLTGQRFHGAQTPVLRSATIAAGRFEAPLLDRLDGELQGILRRALAGERDQRTPTAGRLAAELRAWARTHDAVGDAAALADFMQALFGASRASWEGPSSSAPPPPRDRPSIEATEIGRPPLFDEDLPTDERSSIDDRAIRTELMPRTRLVPPSTLESPSTTTSRPAPPPSRRRVAAAGALVGLTLAVVVVVAVLGAGRAAVAPVRTPPAAVAAPAFARADSVASADAGNADAGNADSADAGSAAAAAASVAPPPTVAAAAPVVAPPSPSSPGAGRTERPRRLRREVEAALARLDGVAASGTPPLVQLKVIREVCGPTACETTMDGALAERVAGCLRSCRASVRRR